MASELSSSENGAGGGGLGVGSGGGPYVNAPLPGARSEVVRTGVMGEYGGAGGEADRSG